MLCFVSKKHLYLSHGLSLNKGSTSKKTGLQQKFKANKTKTFIQEERNSLLEQFKLYLFYNNCSNTSCNNLPNISLVGIDGGVSVVLLEGETRVYSENPLV